MTIVIVGSGADATLDKAASALGSGAVVMRPADLSRPGWCLDPHQPLDGTVVAGRQAIANRDVEYVVVTLPQIRPAELVWFENEDDRYYAAAEMTALLRYWLSAFPAKAVVGAPTGPGLAGASLQPSQWRGVLSAAGATFDSSGSADDAWVATWDGRVRTNCESLASVARHLSELSPAAEARAARGLPAPAGYLWMTGTIVDGNVRTGECRDIPRLADSREVQAIAELLGGVRS